jgi:hypothetical protein
MQVTAQIISHRKLNYDSPFYRSIDEHEQSEKNFLQLSPFARYSKSKLSGTFGVAVSRLPLSFRAFPRILGLFARF